MPTLADIFSTADSLKRRLSDTLRNPGASLDQMVNYANDRARTINEMTRMAAEEKDLYGPSTQALGQKLTEAYNPIGMTVYHGSPHVFERFDLGKIGTGEGAQAYGRGLYMAQSPEVARIYSADRKYVGSAMQSKPLPINYDDPKWIAQKTIDEHGDPAKAISHLQMVQRTAGKYQSAETKNAVQGALDLIAGGEITPKGYVYKVDLPDTHVRRMLDWDEPLKNQPVQVRKLAKSLGMDLNDLGGDLIGKIGKGDEGKQILEKAGIRGVKYLGQEKGTRNFVVFDPNHLTVLERNNQPIK